MQFASKFIILAYLTFSATTIPVSALSQKSDKILISPLNFTHGKNCKPSPSIET